MRQLRLAAAVTLQRHQHLLLLIQAHEHQRFAAGVQHLAAATAQGQALFTQRRHALEQRQQWPIPVGDVPRERFAAERIVAAVQPNLIAIIEARHTDPAQQPHRRHLHARRVPLQQREETRGIVAVQLIELDQLAAVRQPGAVTVHPLRAPGCVQPHRVVGHVQPR